MTLPIEQIPNRTPPRFRWRQRVTTPNGSAVVEHEGSVPLTIEQALQSLIVLCKQQAKHIEELQRDNEGLQGQLIAATDRIAAQSELLSERAEKPTAKRGK